MHDLVVQLLRYARETWRFRWWMLGISWTVCLIGWAVVARLPDQYQATSRVYVDTESVLAPLLSGIAIQSGGVERRLMLMTRTLLSQPNMEKLLRMTDLDLQAKTPQEQEAQIERLRRKIAFSGAGRENLYTISYQDSSPELAKLVVKSLLTIFMETNLGDARKDQDAATQFVEQQIKDYERRLIEAEQGLAKFKLENIGFLPKEEGDYYQNLRRAQEKLEAAQLELKIEQDRVEILRKQLSGETPSFGIAPVPTEVTANTKDIDRRIELNQARLDELLLRFTEKHPDVTNLRRTINDLKAERKTLIANAQRGGADPESPSYDVNSNPVYQQMRIALSRAEAEVGAKQAVVNEFEERIVELQKAIDRILKTETEQSQLNRDYQVLKRNHDQLVSRLEGARLARKADTRSESVRFRVIDPPRVPSKPSGPNRLLLSSGVLFGGLLLGTAVAFLFGQLRPTFDERRLLNERTGLPVLGSIDMVWTQGQLRARQRRNVSFLVSVFGLVAVYGLVMAIYLMGDDALSKLTGGMGLS